MTDDTNDAKQASECDECRKFYGEYATYHCKHKPDTKPASECICGEINARHCPVHNEPASAEARQFWIMDGCAYESTKDTGGMVHVIEKSAYDALKEKYGKHIGGECDAEIEKLKAELTTWRNCAETRGTSIGRFRGQLVKVRAERDELRRFHAEMGGVCDDNAMDILRKVTLERDQLRAEVERLKRDIENVEIHEREEYRKLEFVHALTLANTDRYRTALERIADAAATNTDMLRQIARETLDIK